MTGKAKWRVESKKFQVVTRFDSLILEEDREFFVSKERLHTDIELRDILQYPVSENEIRAGLESWMREALIKPFAYTGEMVDGAFVAFGQNMVTMAQHGLEERIGQVGEARARADLAGVERICTWLRDEAENGDVLCLLSPPGSVEEGFGAHGERRLSFTQFGVVAKEAGRTSVRMISIPEREISIRDHIWRLHQVWDDATLPWLRSTEKTDRGLVSTPLFIPARYVGNGLDTYAKIQGKSGWQEIEHELLMGMKLEGDELSVPRRHSLIDTITWQTLRYVDEQDAERLDNISQAARFVMAREAAGKYIRWTSEQIGREYLEVEGAMWFKEQYKHLSSVERLVHWMSRGAETVAAYQILHRLQEQLGREQDVREMLAGSSCGGGGIGDLLGRGSGSYFEELGRKAQGLEGSSGEESSTTMKCVQCPFCHETVDAIVTSSKIKCPSCKKEVSRSSGIDS